MQHTVNVVVKRHRTKRGTHRGVNHVSVNAVNTGVVQGHRSANRTQRRNLRRTNVISDQEHRADARASSDAKHLAVVKVVGGASASSQGDAIGCASSGSASYGRRNGRLSQGTCLEHLAEARCRTGSATTSQFHAERAFNASVGEQLLGCTQIGSHQVAVDHITLLRSDVQIPHQNGISAIG